MIWLLWIALSLLWIGMRMMLPPLLQHKKQSWLADVQMGLPVLWPVGNTLLILLLSGLIVTAWQNLYGWATLVLLVASLLWGGYRFYQHWLGISCYVKWKWNPQGLLPFWEGQAVEIQAFQAHEAVALWQERELLIPYGQLQTWALPLNNERPPSLVLSLPDTGKNKQELERELLSYLIAQPEILPTKGIKIELKNATGGGFQARINYKTISKAAAADRLASRMRQRFEVAAKII